MLPILLSRNRDRRALAAANGRRFGIERANVIAQLGGVVLLLVVIATLALRGC